MKIALCESWRFLVCTSVLSFFFLAAAPAQHPSQSNLIFSAGSHLLQSSCSLPSGHYLGSGSIIVVPPPGGICHFEIPPNTIIESTRLVFQAGSRLRVRGARLVNCQIQVEAGAEVDIASSVLENCELGGSATPGNAAPSFRIRNCILQGGGWTTPGNLFGLEILDCLIREQILPNQLLRMEVNAEVTPVSLASRPSIRYTHFEKCLIHPSLLLSISQVTIENSTAAFEPDVLLFGAPSDTSPDILLPVRWVSNSLLSLPKVGGGVALQRVSEPISGGFTLAAELQTAAAASSSISSPSPQSLLSVLPSSSSPPVLGGMHSTDTSITSSIDAPVPLKLQQSQVNGLLIINLATGKTAGQMTRMTMTSLKGPPGIRFSQPVGLNMLTALREVRKFMELRHFVPPEVNLEISFEEKYSEKGGPSAAVACGLLMESVLTGKKWDPAFAVTGDMNSDGSVQPIGGVAAKMRGATRGDCSILAIPSKNDKALSDILVLDGPVPLASIHVFALDNFEQAVHLASTERPSALQQALDEFEVLRTAILRDPRQTAHLHHPQAISRLQSVLSKAPHSLSARYLLAYAQKRAPDTLSLAGSVEFAESNALGLLNSMGNAMEGRLDTLKPDELGADLNRLRRLRSQLDARVRPFVDALIDYGESVRTMVLNPARTAAKFYDLLEKVQMAGNNVYAIKKKLWSDPQVIKELDL
jgi:hypothetical protein